MRKRIRYVECRYNYQTRYAQVARVSRLQARFQEEKGGGVIDGGCKLLLSSGIVNFR